MTVVDDGPQTVHTVTVVVQPSAIDDVAVAVGLTVVLQLVVTSLKPVGQISVYTATGMH